jgi:ketosteroid isomerase-like protein
MTRSVMSRRHLLRAGAVALTAAVSLPALANASASGEQDSTNEEIIRKWYAAWVNKDLSTFNMLMADNFTFSSAAGDDHISKSTFKTRCWDSQAQLIDHYDLERITAGAEDAFVKYLGHTKSGKSFRNVEYFRIKNGMLESLECYFGAQSNYPSAVNSG